VINAQTVLLIGLWINAVAANDNGGQRSRVHFTGSVDNAQAPLLRFVVVVCSTINLQQVVHQNSKLKQWTEDFDLSWTCRGVAANHGQLFADKVK